MKLLVNRGAHYEYRDADTGEQFFSVSQVREVMWDGFDKIPYAVLEQARERGDRLHAYFALRMGAIVNVCPEPELIAEYAGYCQAINRFIEKHRPIPTAIEEPSVDRKLGTAGTRDTDVVLLDTKRSRFDILDLKTGEPTPTDPVQLMAYGFMEGCEQHDRKFDLYVHADGTYDFKEVKPILHQADWAAFLNALQILKWRVNK